MPGSVSGHLLGRMGRIVGIDLGTTNSVLAVWKGPAVVVANAEGLRTTPSVVGFSREKELLVGQAARRQLVLNPRDSFSNLKRLIGRQWQELDEASRPWPTRSAPMTWPGAGRVPSH